MVDHDLCLLDAGDLFGPRNRVIGIADPIDEAFFVCLCGGKDPAVGQFAKSIIIEVGSAVPDHAEELFVKAVDDLLQDDLFVFAEFVQRRAHVFHLAALDGDGGDADFFHRSGDAECLHDRADASGDAAWLGDDAVATGGQVIAAAGRHIQHTGDHGIARLSFVFKQRVMHHIRRGDRTAGGVEPNHDGFDIFIAGRFVQFFEECADGVVAVLQPSALFSIEHDAVDINHDDLVGNEHPLVPKDLRFLQFLIGRDHLDLKRSGSAAGNT